MLTKASRGRKRLNAGIPGQSLLLLKPTGGIPHGGGRRIAPDSEIAAILQDWIAAGMPGPGPDDLKGLRIRVEPPDLVIPPTLEDKAAAAGATGVALTVVATFSDGSSRDVTPWALGWPT